MYDAIASNKRKSWLLVLLFTAVIGLLGYTWGLHSGDRFGALTLAGFIAIGLGLTGYYAGDRIALGLAGAREITKAENPYVWNLVENLNTAQVLHMKRGYLTPERAMNAFACGRDPAHASIALTQGLLAGLANEELEGVIAHELAHVKNYDIRFGTLIAILVGAVAILSDLLLRSHIFGGGHSRGSREGGNVLVVVGFVLALLAPLAANLIKLAVSRQRELLADAAGALATRYPEGLARALEKIEQQAQPLERVSEATAHLYFASPFGKTPKLLGRLFATHPPVAERVAALRQMAR